MSDKDNEADVVEEIEEVEFFDPFESHFISQNRRNGFIGALEDDRSALTYSTVH